MTYAANTPKPVEMSLERATSIANGQVKGTIKSNEYEFEKGQVNHASCKAVDKTERKLLSTPVRAPFLA